MKSIEEKAKRYDELKVTAQRLEEDGCFDKITLFDLFPELKESEDERIRKAIINVFASHKDYEVFFGASVEDILAWLEKQAEQKSIDNLTPQEAMDIAVAKCFEQGEQKPAKVEPKFKIGDWVILTAGELSSTLKIVGIDSKKKKYYFDDYSFLPIVDEDLLSLWTIQDAEDGDLIYVATEEKGVQAIFHEYKNDIIFFHCYLCVDFAQGGYMSIGSVDMACPLQKTNYNRFFEKMHEAGYEWDAEKKELKKIKHESVWSDEDEKIKKVILEALITDDAIKILVENAIYYEGAENWLKSLKERVVPQQKKEWSEEDEKILSDIIKDLVHPWNEYIPERIEYEIKWLKNVLQV